MASQKSDFRHESLQDRQTIVRYLNALSEGIASGRLVLGTREEEIVLEPEGLLKLDVKARQKSDEAKVTFKISWKSNGHGDSPIKGPLSISSEKAD